MTSDEHFVEFVRARATALVRTAYLLTAGDRHAAEDLVQSALTQAFVKRKNIRDPAATEAYVRRILLRLAIRRAKDGWRGVHLVGEPRVHEAETNAPGDLGDRLAVLASLRTLPPRQRAVMVLRYYENFSESQIAEALGCSRGAVKSHSFRALNTLRGLLAPQFSPSQPTSRTKENP